MYCTENVNLNLEKKMDELIEKARYIAYAALYSAEIQDVLDQQGNLMYASLFGSHLYGCHREESDVDVKGIFLPHAKNVLNIFLTSKREELIMIRSQKKLVILWKKWKNWREHVFKETNHQLIF